jgi:CelD/BcsL family acetyltransferase involved in cellulose biosynthesis
MSDDGVTLETLAAAPSGRATTMQLSLTDALALGPDAWDRLQSSSSAASPFSGWAWHRAWADAAPPADVGAGQALLVLGADGSPQAVLPFALRRTRWRRMGVEALTWAAGDVGCPDHLDLLALPDADLETLADALDALPWDVAIFGNLADPAPNVARLCAALERRGLAVRQGALWPCPRLALPETWDDYLASLSPTRRQLVRRKERGLHQKHAVTLTDYAGGRVAEGWRHLVRLHEERWSGAGAFRQADVRHLQQVFAQTMAERNRLWLTTLDVDGEPAAAWYGFNSDDTVYFYQSGRAPKWERESVGLVLMGMMIRRAIERGYRWFDFLRGDDAYKSQWTTDRRMTRETVVFRPGWHGRLLRALDWVGERRRHA